jgi:hypothetical protein
MSGMNGRASDKEDAFRVGRKQEMKRKKLEILTYLTG